MGPASLTALVAIYGPQLNERRKQRFETKKLRATKLESLIGLLHNHTYWLEMKRDAWVFAQNIEFGASPLPDVEALIYIYFPQLNSQLITLKAKASGHELWIVTAKKKRFGNEADFTAGFMESYSPYTDAVNSMMVEIAMLAKQEFGTEPTVTADYFGKATKLLFKI